MKTVVCSFKDADSLSTEQLGAKASKLLWLRKNGFNVPNGFCVTSDAYQDHAHLFQNDVHHSEIDPEKIRTLILGKPFNPETVAHIEKCYGRLSKAAVAVRSSATAEDLPGHSFAGQYETFLNIESLADCLEAIKKCWASLWTERACSYREKNKIDHFNVNMAVIVQEQIPADVAGVMFTADPLRGKTDRIIIEACPGLGEALVSGKVTPDEMIFAKKTLRPIWIFPADLNKPSCLNIHIAQRLAKAGRKIEKLCGNPQDIEWAIHNGQIHFLQTRPVTVKPIEQSWEDRQIWTNINTGEVLPDVLMPLDWSIINMSFMPMFRHLFWILGIEIGTHPLMGIVAGRVYFNFNTGMAFFTKLSPWLMKPQDGHVLFGGGDTNQYDLRKINFGPDDLPDLKVSIWKILWRMPRSLILLFTHRASKATKALEYLKQKHQHYDSISYDTMTMQQIVMLINEIVEKTYSKVDLLYLHGLASNFFVLILCAKWLDDKNGILANTLLKAAGGMDDVQAGVALMELAQRARLDEQICSTIDSAEHWDDIKPKLIPSETGQQFVEAWDTFMRQHGHHCRSEILVSNPRWCEKPDYVLEMIKACLSQADLDTPGRRYKQQLQDQHERVEAILSRLHNPIKRGILRRQIKRALHGLTFRENVKSEVVRILSMLRTMILKLAQHMHEGGLLSDPEDVFFLSWAEIESAIHNATDYNHHPAIQQRRQDYQRFKDIDPPQVIVGKFDSDSFIPKTVDMAIREFHGMSACPGKASGKARVILRADEDQQVLPGEILVAPFTDPGWTPYFINAAAIVMDQGGLLSHGSIVAREYGIPAVVNVGPATKIIQTGQILEVDADQGIVRIVS